MANPCTFSIILRGFCLLDLLMMSKLHRENLRVSPFPTKTFHFVTRSQTRRRIAMVTRQTPTRHCRNEALIRTFCAPKLSRKYRSGLMEASQLTIYDVKTTSGSYDHESVKNKCKNIPLKVNVNVYSTWLLLLLLFIFRADVVVFVICRSLFSITVWRTVQMYIVYSMCNIRTWCQFRCDDVGSAASWWWRHVANGFEYQLQPWIETSRLLVSKLNED